MNALTPSQRRALRAKAHHLHAVVIVGQHGLTPAVLHEIDVALLAHELVKIRVVSDARDERSALLERICTEMDAAPVQHLGKVLTVWRPKPAPEAGAPDSRLQRTARRPRHAPATADPAARRAGARKPPDSGVTGGRGNGEARPRGKAATSRRRPSDVTSTGASAKRRSVKGGRPPEERKRAPATAKGPFEPGKRTAQRRPGAVAGRPGAVAEPTTRRRRRQP